MDCIFLFLCFLHAVTFMWSFLTPKHTCQNPNLLWGLTQDSTHCSKLFFIFLTSFISLPLLNPGAFCMYLSIWQSLKFSSNLHIGLWPFGGQRLYARKEKKKKNPTKVIITSVKPSLYADFVQVLYSVTQHDFSSFPVASVIKNLPAKQETQVPFPGEESGNPLQYACLGNPTDREAWQATVHGIAKS